MRLEKIQNLLKDKYMEYEYHEMDECGSIDFVYRGVPYHIWEFHEGDEWGAETNVQHGGHIEDYTGDYEDQIIEIIENWQ